MKFSGISRAQLLSELKAEREVLTACVVNCVASVRAHFERELSDVQAFIAYLVGLVAKAAQTGSSAPRCTFHKAIRCTFAIAKDRGLNVKDESAMRGVWSRSWPPDREPRRNERRRLASGRRHDEARGAQLVNEYSMLHKRRGARIHQNAQRNNAMPKAEIEFEATHAPNNLAIAAAALTELHRNDFADALSNEAPEAHAEIVALVAQCREALDDVETLTRDELERSAKWHREGLAGIEALGVIASV